MKKHFIATLLLATLAVLVFLVQPKQYAPDIAPRQAIEQVPSTSANPTTESMALNQYKQNKFMSEPEFRALTENTLKKIPTISDLRQLHGEAVHEVPQAVLSAGMALGQVAEVLEDNPKLASIGFHFYESCVRNTNFPPSVRALCYANYSNLGPKLEERIDTNIAPKEIRELSEKIK
jgi:hypothetical protein